MSVHDGLVAYRRQVMSLIEASSNKRLACRQAGIHHSTFYRWRHAEQRRVAGGSAAGLRAMSWVDRVVEERIIAAALAKPGLGPVMVAYELADAGVLGVVERPAHLDGSADEVVPGRKRFRNDLVERNRGRQPAVDRLHRPLQARPHYLELWLPTDITCKAAVARHLEA